MRLTHLVLSLGAIVALGGAFYACSSSEETPPAAATGGGTGTGGTATGGAGGGATGGSSLTGGGAGKGTGGGGTGGSVDAGGDGSSGGFAALIPAGTEITGWTASTTAGMPQIAYNKTDAIAAVDGTADDIYTDAAATSPVAMGHQVYSTALSDGNVLTLEYFLWQMPSATVAQDLYASLPTKVGNLWVEVTNPVTPTIGDRSAYGIRGGAVHLVVQKGAYLLDIKGPIGVSLADIEAFATAAAAKVK
jgi:hypothetical protein